MAVDRLLPTEESADLLELVRELCAHELAPHAAHPPKHGRPHQKQRQ